MGHLLFEGKIWNLPKVGQPGWIEDVTSSKILCVKNSNEIVLKTKPKTTNTVTRASVSSQLAKKISDPKNWVAGQTNANGWFRIKHVSSGKYLTSSNTDSVTIEDLFDSSDLKQRKTLVKVEKDFIFCPNLDTFGSHIAKKRKYTDPNVQSDMGLDGGGGFFKVLMSVQPKKT